MHQNQGAWHLKLVLREARQRFKDAELLEDADPLAMERGNSAYLLELLGLELLL